MSTAKAMSDRQIAVEANRIRAGLRTLVRMAATWSPMVSPRSFPRQSWPCSGRSSVLSAKWKTSSNCVGPWSSYRTFPPEPGENHEHHHRQTAAGGAAPRRHVTRGLIALLSEWDADTWVYVDVGDEESPRSTALSAPVGAARRTWLSRTTRTTTRTMTTSAPSWRRLSPGEKRPWRRRSRVRSKR